MIIGRIQCQLCGTIHEEFFRCLNDWACIKKDVCPECGKGLPPETDPLWKDDNWVDWIMTDHRPYEGKEK